MWYWTLVCSGALALSATSGLSILPDMFDCAVEIEDSFEQRDLQVYIVSDPRCGYCDRALRQIGAWAQDKSVNVIALDVSGKAEKLRSHEALQFYSELNIHILNASACSMKYRKVIPKVYVFDRSLDKPLFKLNGWGKTDLVKFEQRLSKYL
jgi:hypothetical protein